MWPSQESVDPSVPIPSVTKLEGKTDRGTKLGLTKEVEAVEKTFQADTKIKVSLKCFALN